MPFCLFQVTLVTGNLNKKSKYVESFLTEATRHCVELRKPISSSFGTIPVSLLTAGLITMSISIEGIVLSPTAST